MIVVGVATIIRPNGFLHEGADVLLELSADIPLESHAMDGFRLVTVDKGTDVVCLSFNRDHGRTIGNRRIGAKHGKSVGKLGNTYSDVAHDRLGPFCLQVATIGSNDRVARYVGSVKACGTDDNVALMLHPVFADATRWCYGCHTTVDHVDILFFEGLPRVLVSPRITRGVESSHLDT